MPCCQADMERDPLMKVLEIVDELPPEEQERLIEALAEYYGYEVEEE